MKFVEWLNPFECQNIPAWFYWRANISFWDEGIFYLRILGFCFEKTC